MKKIRQSENAEKRPRGRPRGRALRFHINLPLAPETIEQIEKQLKDGETRVSFIREAIDDKLRRRAKRKD